MRSVAAGLLSLALAANAQPEMERKLYRAAIAAADGALRLHEPAAAQYWLAEAPAAQRGWEWRYLQARAQQSYAAVQAHESPITGLGVSADGKLLATTSGDKTVRLWDAATGAAVAVLEGHKGATWSPAFRAGGGDLATMGSDGAVRIWSVKERAEVRRYEKVGQGLGAVAWSADGKLLASASWTFEPGKGVKGWIHVWEYEKNALLWRSEYGAKPIPALAFRPDGMQLAAATWDGWVAVFAIDGGGKPAGEVRLSMADGTYPAMQSVAYSADGTMLAAVGKDNLTRIYESASMKPLRELSGHTRWVNGVAFAPAGGWLATGSSDATLRLWEVQTGAVRQVLHGHTASLNAIAVTPDGKRLITGAADGTLRWWDAEKAADVTRRTWTHGDAVYGLSFSGSGDRAATAAWGGTLKMWDSASGKALWAKPIHQSSANAVAFHPDGALLVSGGNDGQLQLVDAMTGSVRATWEKVDNGRAAGIAWSGDGRWVLCPSSRPTGKLWDADAGTARHTITGGTGEMYAVAFSRDSRWAAAGWSGGETKVIDVASGADALVLPKQAGGIYAVAFSPDGKRLATGGGDRRIRIWELPSGRLLQTLDGHTELVYGLDYSRDGTRLASASIDQTVRLWAPEAGEPMLAVPFPVQVYGVKFTPDGKRLAALPMNGTVVWLDAP